LCGFGVWGINFSNSPKLKKIYKDERRGVKVWPETLEN